MILQSLVEYYDALEKKGEITEPGWCRAKVSYALDIGENGELKGLIPLKEEGKKGKKTVMVPKNLKVPEMDTTRASKVKANFLCDNSSYFLGIDNKGRSKRTKECFEDAKKTHKLVLGDIKSKAAKSLLKYFDTWIPEKAMEHTELKEDLKDLMTSNIVFYVDGVYVHEDEEVRKAWENYLTTHGEEEDGVCLVTGQITKIAKKHGVIKGVQGGQQNGGVFVSFNENSFESYGKKSNLNAPIGTYAVHAYTTALNDLLQDRSHTTIIGDTTIVYWAESGEEEYKNVFAAFSEPTGDNQKIVDNVFKNLQSGKGIAVEDISLDLNQRFYILGIAPNAARLAVRFFFQDSFGNILNNLKRHYERMNIVRPASDQMEYLGIWRMLQETVNKKSRDKKPVSNMAGAVYRAVISGGQYPTSLYQSVLLRIRAEQDDSDSHIYKITRGRAAIIKAFLMKNLHKEELTMALNENSQNIAYTLGREFAVLEAIQQEANPGINATIKDRYFNSACATPAAIFPILFKLKNSHIRKLDNKGKEIYYERMLIELQEKLSLEESQVTACPRRLSLEEQGMFILGYYHQLQKRFEKKTKEEEK